MCCVASQKPPSDPGTVLQFTQWLHGNGLGHLDDGRWEAGKWDRDNWARHPVYTLGKGLKNFGKRTLQQLQQFPAPAPMDEDTVDEDGISIHGSTEDEDEDGISIHGSTEDEDEDGISIHSARGNTVDEDEEVGSAPLHPELQAIISVAQGLGELEAYIPDITFVNGMFYHPELCMGKGRPVKRGEFEVLLKVSPILLQHPLQVRIAIDKDLVSTCAGHGMQPAPPARLQGHAHLDVASPE